MTDSTITVCLQWLRPPRHTYSNSVDYNYFTMATLVKYVALFMIVYANHLR